MKAVGLLLAMALAVPTGSGMVAAQQPGSLDEVEALMAEGRIIRAREVLLGWMDSRLSSASRDDRQRSIWLRGKLTVDPSMAEADFGRLVLEYPGGPYSDDALFRLGLSAELRGDRTGARSHLEALVRDYPASPLARDAEVWLGKLRAESTSPVAGAPRGAAADSGAVAPATAAPPAGLGPTEASLSFSVQLGAFSSLERALTLADRLTQAGYEARVVLIPGNELVRVRVGRFPTRQAAEAQALELEAGGFEVRVVADAWSEERVVRQGR